MRNEKCERDECAARQLCTRFAVKTCARKRTKPWQLEHVSRQVLAQLLLAAAVGAAHGAAAVLGQAKLLELEREHLFLDVVLGRRAQNEVERGNHGLDVAQLKREAAARGELVDFLPLSRRKRR